MAIVSLNDSFPLASEQTDTLARFFVFPSLSFLLSPLLHYATLWEYCTIALISHASKVMLKILQARLQQYVNCELLDVQAGFIKGRGTRDQIANIRWIIEKVRELQKNI